MSHTVEDVNIRMSALSLTIEHFKGARTGDKSDEYIQPERLIAQAAKLEAYIREGAPLETSTPTKG